MAVLVAMTGNIALLMVVLVCAFFVVAHRRGQLPLRQGFGIRTNATTADERTWFAAHEAAVPALLRVVKVALLSMIPAVAIGAILGRFLPLGGETAALVLVFAGYAVTGWYLVQAVRVADAAAHAVLYPGESDPLAAAEAVNSAAPGAHAVDSTNADGPVSGGLDAGALAAAREPSASPTRRPAQAESADDADGDATSSSARPELSASAS